MHDIKRELLVVCSRIIHSKFSVLRPKHGGFAEDHYTALAKRQGQSLSATSGGTFSGNNTKGYFGRRPSGPHQRLAYKYKSSDA